ncbi:hypothetical protein D0T49_06925 [Paludibacter sp. 221]|uniref:hypothetical protein n=1 Tax=Paludibacter sp. 221 TaxID=2302939 RepID=UPI0013D4F7EF|nr:hypothetical protein [Paludibacter sp. 221]NDV46777.1 hypothetical protein [Paludibacter sp. 221]
MKKIVFYFTAIVFVSLLFTACKEEPVFDEDLLIGKWRMGTLYEKYLPNYDGYTWDTSEDEDVEEEEAQKFTWTLVNSTLRQIHIMEIGGSFPKTYTVTELTSTKLTYEDDFGKVKSFVKVD